MEEAEHDKQLAENATKAYNYLEVNVSPVEGIRLAAVYSRSAEKGKV